MNDKQSLPSQLVQFNWRNKKALKNKHYHCVKQDKYLINGSGPTKGARNSQEGVITGNQSQILSGPDPIQATSWPKPKKWPLQKGQPGRIFIFKQETVVVMEAICKEREIKPKTEVEVARGQRN